MINYHSSDFVGSISLPIVLVSLLQHVASSNFFAVSSEIFVELLCRESVQIGTLEIVYRMALL